MNVEHSLQAFTGDIDEDTHGVGVAVGQLHRIAFPSVASVGAGAALTSVQSRVHIARPHRVRGVSFACSGLTAVSLGTDPAVDVYRHLPIPVGLTAALASPAAAGNVDAGAHGYAVAFYNGAGIGQVCAPVYVTVANAAVNGKVALTFPNGPTGTTGKKIYRTAAAGTALLLLATIADNTTQTYLDNTADSGLGAAVGASNAAGATILSGTVKLSAAAATNADRSLTDQELPGTLAAGTETYVADGVIYTLRALTGASTGAITNLQAFLEVEFRPVQS